MTDEVIYSVTFIDKTLPDCHPTNRICYVVESNAKCDTIYKLMLNALESHNYSSDDVTIVSIERYT